MDRQLAYAINGAFRILFALAVVGTFGIAALLVWVIFLIVKAVV